MNRMCPQDGRYSSSLRRRDPNAIVTWSIVLQLQVDEWFESKIDLLYFCRTLLAKQYFQYYFLTTSKKAWNVVHGGYIALSPGHTQLLNVACRKERGPGASWCGCGKLNSCMTELHTAQKFNLQRLHHVVTCTRPSRFSACNTESWVWPGDKARWRLDIMCETLHGRSLLCCDWQYTV